MFDNNPISSNKVKYASVLDPKDLVSQPLDVCKSLIQRLILTLVHLKIKYSSQANLEKQALNPFRKSMTV